MTEDATKATEIPVITPLPGITLPAAGRYTFSFDKFEITETRSIHKDTDYAGINLTIAQGGDPNRIFQPVIQTKSMGDLNNGTFPVNLSFKNVELADTDVAIFSYTIINSSKGQSSADDALKTALPKLTTAALNEALGVVLSTIGISFPGLGPVISYLTGLVVSEFSGLFPGGCDGPVAAGVHSFSGAQLKALLASGAYSKSDNNPGVTSADGCGHNSNYIVFYSIKSA